MASEIYDNYNSEERYFTFVGRNSYRLGTNYTITTGSDNQLLFNTFTVAAQQLPTNLIGYNTSNGAFAFNRAGNYSVKILCAITVPLSSPLAIVGAKLQMITPGVYTGSVIDQSQVDIPASPGGGTVYLSLSTVSYFAAGEGFQPFVSSTATGFVVNSGTSIIFISRIN